MTALWLCAFLAAPGTLIDRIVAVVDKQVVTQSELLVEARVALAMRQGELLAAGDLDEEFLTTFRDYLVNQHLVAFQARKSGAPEIPLAQIEREVQRFTQNFRSPDAYRAFLRRFDIPEDTLRNLLARNLRNDRYVADRMRLRVQGDGPGSPRYQEALQRWLAELRVTAEIRVLGPSGELERLPTDGTPERS